MGDEKIVAWLLSGGGDPSGNHYSQYLQAKRLNEFLEQRPDVELTTMFGAGYTPTSSGARGTLPDVQHQPQENGPMTLIRGNIANNLPATHTQVDAYLRTALPARRWQKGDRFLLITADHGMPNVWDPRTLAYDKRLHSNNCINLWQPQLTTYPERKCLSVAALHQTITVAIPPTVPVTYVMTQCFSGGFHALAFTTDAAGMPRAVANRCGFSATTNDALASGCTSYVSETTYDGYERRIAEALTGVSIMTGQSLHPPMLELSEAHDEAMRLDNTIDIPMRSSDAFVLASLEASLAGNQPTAPQQQEAELSSLWEDIREQWHEDSALPIGIARDLARRRTLVRSLEQQFEAWHPEYRGKMVASSVRGIKARLTTVKGILEGLHKRLSTLREDIDALWEPSRQAYVLALGDNVKDTARERFEFEMIQEYSNSIVYSRLAERDPTLALFTRYLNYKSQRDDIIDTWAVAQQKITTENWSRLQQHYSQQSILNSEIGRLDIIQGQLQRISVQLRAAAGIVWLHEHNAVATMRDIAQLIACETSATFAPQP